jgi:hypothetical protein
MDISLDMLTLTLTTMHLDLPPLWLTPVKFQ